MIANGHFAQRNERQTSLISIVDTCAKRVCMKFDTITFPYLNRQCFRRPLPVSNPILCVNKPNNDGIQMSVRFKFQRSSALKCIEGLAWTGAQTDIFVGQDVAFGRNIDLCKSISWFLFSDPCSRYRSQTPPALSSLNIPFASPYRHPAF